MAIDKSHTSPLMKTGIILLAATFVLGIGFAGISGMQGCSAAASAGFRHDAELHDAGIH